MLIIILNLFETFKMRTLTARLTIVLTICLSIWGCVNPQDINWESTPLTGKVKRTIKHPSQIGPPGISIAIELESGEVVLVAPPRNIRFMLKGKDVNLYRGTTDSGREFYSFNLPQPISNQSP